MTLIDEHLSSALRHFGVALIDLNYAAADLAQSRACRSADEKTWETVDLLHQEIAKLRELSTLIESTAAPKPALAP
jgi:hypothetical protein